MTAKNIEGACVLLNQLLVRDREGVSRLFLMSSLVNSTCAMDTPFEVEQSPFPNHYSLYPIGLLNGLFSEYDKEGIPVKRIAVEFDDASIHVKRFYVEALDVECTPPN